MSRTLWPDGREGKGADATRARSAPTSSTAQQASCTSSASVSGGRQDANVRQADRRAQDNRVEVGRDRDQGRGRAGDLIGQGTGEIQKTIMSRSLLEEYPANAELRTPFQETPLGCISI